MDELVIEHNSHDALIAWLEGNAYRIQVTNEYDCATIPLTKPEAIQLRDKLNELLGH